MNNIFAATNAQIAADAAVPKPSKKPLTEEQKDALRARLAVARAKRSELARAGKLKTRSPKPKPQNLANETLPIIAPAATFTKWSDDEWRTNDYKLALQRLADLHEDRERGASLIMQRQNSENIRPTYKCIVCRRTVIDGQWGWKNDRRDPITNLFTSDVMCRDSECHARFQNNQHFYLNRAKGVS